MRARVARPGEEPRYPLDQAVALRFKSSDGFIGEQAANVSSGGMFVRTRHTLPVGSILEFELRPEEGLPAIEGKAQVSWVRRPDRASAEPPGMGVRFVELDERHHRTLQRLIAARRGGSAPDADPGPPDQLPPATVAARAEPAPPSAEADAAEAAGERIALVGPEPAGGRAASPESSARPARAGADPPVAPEPAPGAGPAPHAPGGDGGSEAAERRRPTAPAATDEPPPLTASTAASGTTDPVPAVAPRAQGADRRRGSARRRSLLLLPVLAALAATLILWLEPSWAPPPPAARAEPPATARRPAAAAPTVSRAPEPASDVPAVSPAEPTPSGIPGPAPEEPAAEPLPPAPGLRAPASGGGPPPAASPERSAAAIEAVLAAWADAWSGQRVEEYLAHYSPEFEPPGGLSRDRWREERRRRLRSPGWIRVRIAFPETRRVGDDAARAEFVQAYDSDTYRDVVRKRLDLRREDGRWLITGEETVP